MATARRAVIDVGTNSVKVLVADVEGSEIHPLWESSKQTRLGSGFYETHRLQAGPIANTAQAVAHFAAEARGRGAETVRVIATSAARDAMNPGELTGAIERASGLPVEIISGEQEAEWVFQGVATDPALADGPLLLLDVGGGSTEFILGHGRQMRFRQSFPLGTVRLLEKMPHSDPPKMEEFAACQQWLDAFLTAKVRPKLLPELRREADLSSANSAWRMVGTGGTATILARMEAKLEEFDRNKIEGARLEAERMRWHLNRLWALPLAGREQIVGLPKRRADVILTGVAIYDAVMRQFGFAELRVSTRGLRFAALMDG